MHFSAQIFHKHSICFENSLFNEWTEWTIVRAELPHNGGAQRDIGGDRRSSMIGSAQIRIEYNSKTIQQNHAESYDGLYNII